MGAGGSISLVCSSPSQSSSSKWSDTGARHRKAYLRGRQTKASFVADSVSPIHLQLPMFTPALSFLDGRNASRCQCLLCTVLRGRPVGALLWCSRLRILRCFWVRWGGLRICCPHNCGIGLSCNSYSIPPRGSSIYSRCGQKRRKKNGSHICQLTCVYFSLDRVSVVTEMGKHHAAFTLNSEKRKRTRLDWETQCVTAVGGSKVTEAKSPSTSCKHVREVLPDVNDPVLNWSHTACFYQIFFLLFLIHSSKFNH